MNSIQVFICLTYFVGIDVYAYCAGSKLGYCDMAPLKTTREVEAGVIGVHSLKDGQECYISVQVKPCRLCKFTKRFQNGMSFALREGEVLRCRTGQTGMLYSSFGRLFTWNICAILLSYVTVNITFKKQLFLLFSV